MSGRPRWTRTGLLSLSGQDHGPFYTGVLLFTYEADKPGAPRALESLKFLLGATKSARLCSRTSRTAFAREVGRKLSARKKLEPLA